MKQKHKAVIASRHTRLVSLRIPHDVLAGLDKVAKAINVDRSAAARAIFRLYLRDRADKTLLALTDAAETKRRTTSIFE